MCWPLRAVVVRARPICRWARVRCCKPATPHASSWWARLPVFVCTGRESHGTTPVESGCAAGQAFATNASTTHPKSRSFRSGFCYPGRGRGGDLPPRRECADLWLDALLDRLPHLELTLLIGLYAQRHFLGRRRKSSLTETVKAWREFAPDFFPLPHPSARNTPGFSGIHGSSRTCCQR